MSLILNKIGGDESWDKTINVGLPTGCTVFDVLTSTIEKDIYRRKTILNGGLVSQVTTIVGESGTGKSTIIQQLIGGAMVLFRYKNPHLETHGEEVYIDTEGFANVSRLTALSNWTEYEVAKDLYLEKEVFSPTAIYNLIKKIADAKEQNGTVLKYDSHMCNLVNDRIKTYVPTFVVIDSVVNMNEAKEFEYDRAGELKDDDALFSNTDGFKDARNNANFLKKIKPLLVKYNIALIMVNHIVDKPALNMYEKQNRSLPWLPGNKTLKGGIQMIFQTAFLPRLEYLRKHSDEKSRVYGDRINGQINTIEFWKNKNGPEGIKIPMVFDSNMGYVYELCDFEMLSSVGYGISGVSSMHMTILPEIKFSRKTLLDTCEENPLLARAIQFTAKLYLVYSFVKKQDPIDLEQLASLPLKDRISLILAHSTYYPRYIAEKRFIKMEHLQEMVKSNLKFDTKSDGLFDERALDTIENYKNGYTRWMGRVTAADYMLSKKRDPNAKFLWRQESE